MRKQMIYPEIAKYMAIKKINQKELAEVVGISQQSLSVKLTGKCDFRRSEMVSIREYFKEADPGLTMDKLFNIFLSQ